MLHGAADCFIAAPGVVRVFTAFGEASATDGDESRSQKNSAGPAFLVAVVGFASSDTPESSSDPFLPVSLSTSSVVVKEVAFGSVSGGGSIVKPGVFRPPSLVTDGDLVAFGGWGDCTFHFSKFFAFFPGYLTCPEECELSLSLSS